MCLFFRLDMKLSLHGKYPILNFWHATIILRHLSSSVAAEIDTILSCCHLANILMWQTYTYAFVPTDYIFKEVMLHPRWALNVVTTPLCVSFVRAVLQPQTQIFIWSCFMMYITWDKMKSVTIHKGQLLDIEKQSGPGMEHVGFCWTWYFPANWIVDWRMTLVWFYVVDRL